MSTETQFVRRWKPSRPFLLVVAISVVGLVVAVALPGLVLPKFSDKPTTLVFQVQVIDDQGIPIPNARVTVGSVTEQTDLDGRCEVPHDFMAKGIKGLSGTCRLEGEMRVEARGYSSWQRALNDVFERNYNYVDKGTNLAHEVALYR